MSALQVEDIAAGDKITVLEALWNRADRSYRGEVVDVVLVELPFVIVQRKGFPRRLILDTREWLFGRVSPEYAQLMNRTN